ncbi:hypothetical protein BC830DRAFT_1082298 [Chytriomyces sp. MP71]|nr:hypothetical protein BC830DRAFT_1082298 [Chytriomyces sp. MP71]
MLLILASMALPLLTTASAQIMAGSIVWNLAGSGVTGTQCTNDGYLQANINFVASVSVNTVGPNPPMMETGLPVITASFFLDGQPALVNTSTTGSTAGVTNSTTAGNTWSFQTVDDQNTISANNFLLGPCNATTGAKLPAVTIDFVTSSFVIGTGSGATPAVNATPILINALQPQFQAPGTNNASIIWYLTGNGISGLQCTKDGELIGNANFNAAISVNGLGSNPPMMETGLPVITANFFTDRQPANVNQSSTASTSGVTNSSTVGNTWTFQTVDDQAAISATGFTFGTCNATAGATLPAVTVFFSTSSLSVGKGSGAIPAVSATPVLINGLDVKFRAPVVFPAGANVILPTVIPADGLNGNTVNNILLPTAIPGDSHNSNTFNNVVLPTLIPTDSLNGNTLDGNTFNGNKLNGNTLNGNTLSGSNLNGNRLNGNAIPASTFTAHPAAPSVASVVVNSFSYLGNAQVLTVPPPAATLVQAPVVLGAPAPQMSASGPSVSIAPPAMVSACQFVQNAIQFRGQQLISTQSLQTTASSFGINVATTGGIIQSLASITPSSNTPNFYQSQCSVIAARFNVEPMVVINVAASVQPIFQPYQNVVTHFRTVSGLEPFYTQPNPLSNQVVFQTSHGLSLSGSPVILPKALQTFVNSYNAGNSFGYISTNPLPMQQRVTLSVDTAGSILADITRLSVNTNYHAQCNQIARAHSVTPFEVAQIAQNFKSNFEQYAYLMPVFDGIANGAESTETEKLGLAPGGSEAVVGVVASGGTVGVFSLLLAAHSLILF